MLASGLHVPNLVGKMSPFGKSNYDAKQLRTVVLDISAKKQGS